MASSINRLGSLALRYTPRLPSRRKKDPCVITSRAFHPSRACRKNEDSGSPAGKQPFDYRSSLSTRKRERYDLLSPEDKVEAERIDRKLHDYMTSPEVQSDLTGETSQAAYDIAASEDKFEIPTALDPRIRPGLMAMGEVDPQDSGADDEFAGDDISSLAHGELEQHREMREFARIAAWEMPLLTSMLLSVQP